MSKEDHQDPKNPKRTKQVDHDAELRKESLIRGRLLWETFRKQFVNTPCKPHEIPGRFIALRDKIEREIVHPEVLQTMLAEVDIAIQKAAKEYPMPLSPKAGRAAKRDAWTARAATKRNRSDGPRPRGSTRPPKPGDPGSGPASGPADPSRN